MGAVLVSLLLLLLPSRAPAAGMITHAWIADEAKDEVSDPKLRQFLRLRRFELLSGGSFPDTGYAAGGYGEISHWERFIDGYVEYLRERPGCADLSDPLGPCAPYVAHMFGAAAHGMGDEMWDWLFEPLIADHGESPDFPVSFPPPFEAANIISSQEYAMDTIALADHFRWADSGYYLPPPNELTPIYDAIGHGQTTEADLVSGFTVGSAALSAERAGGAADAPRVREQMPWASAHMDDESGGVLDSAGGVAGYYDAIWAKVLDEEPPPPKLAAVHPEDGEEGVPFRFLPAKTAPGLSTGGGELRIIAVLSNAVDPATVSSDTFRLLAPDGSQLPARLEEASPTALHQARGDAKVPQTTQVPPLEGFPRPGPYGGSDGTHSLMVYPAVDLQPCTTYTAQLTQGITDFGDLAINAGQSLRKPASWTFSTRSAGGDPCPRIKPPVQIPKCGGLEATVFATRAEAGGAGQRLLGTSGPDVVVASSGNDEVRAGGGDDLICLGGGDDVARASGGDDEIRAGGGEDRVVTGGGDDLARGLTGNDRIKGGGGKDTLHGGAGNDSLDGAGGADTLIGKSGDDRLDGGPDRDRCKGGTPGRGDRARGCERTTGVP